MKTFEEYWESIERICSDAKLVTKDVACLAWNASRENTEDAQRAQKHNWMSAFDNAFDDADWDEWGEPKVYLEEILGIDSQESVEPPYIIKHKVVKELQYNPKYGDNRRCECGHVYYRHFDSYEDNAACGCKYCGCYEFKEASE